MKHSYLLLALFFTTKLFAQPACQWAYVPAGANAYHTIANVTADLNGNIIQTGVVLGVADMDPGVGVADTSFTTGGYNYYVSKTDASGHLTWIRYFQPQGSFHFKDVHVNSNNEIVILGGFFGVVDFDLSAGVDTLRSHFPTYPDYFVAKYDPSGNLSWAFSIGDPTTSDIDAEAFTIQPNDDIVVSANPNGTIDVDPGNSVHNSIGGNANLICYDNNGNYLWNNNINTTYSYGINNRSLEGDAAGNNYLLTVGYYELTVNKFNNAGVRIWDKTIGEFSSGSRVNPQSVLVDKSNGDFYVAGTFEDTVDFDPGASVVSKISTTFNYPDGFIAKYDSSMNLLWVNAYHGNVSFGNYSLAFSGNEIVAVGNLKGSVDFGNGLALSSITMFSPFYIKIDNMGVASNGYILDGSGSYNTIHMINSTSFVTSGSVSNNIDMDPTAGSVILSQTTSNDFDAMYESTPTGISQTLSENNFSAYPNPACNELNISGKAKIESIRITDLTGKEIYSSIVNFSLHYSISLNKFSNGIYFAEVMTDGNKIIKKFVVSK